MLLVFPEHLQCARLYWMLKSIKMNGSVTESGVQMLTALKPILERQGWWKGKFALFWQLATWVGGEGSVDLCPKADFPTRI